MVAKYERHQKEPNLFSILNFLDSQLNLTSLDNRYMISTVRVFKRSTPTVTRFRMAISEYTWHSHILLNVHHWRCHCFYDLSLSRLGFENPTLRLRGGRSNPLRHRSGCFKMEISSCSKVTGPQFAVVYSLYKGNIFEWDMKQLTIQAINTQ